MNQCANERRNAGKDGVRAVFQLCISVLLLLGGAASALRALDPARSLQQYGHERWTQQDGLPGSAVRGVFQLSDGYIWLVSGGNLFRFDGVRFAQIQPVVNGVPMGEAIRAASLAPGNKLLLRSMTRTLHLDQGKFTDALPAMPLPDGVDMAVRETHSGIIWIASDNHIYRAKNGHLELIVSGCSWTHDITEDSQGNVWIATISALFRSRGDHLTRFSPAYAWSIGSTYVPLESPTRGEVALKLPQEATSLMEERSGCLWIGTVHGLFKLKDGMLVQDADAAPLKGCVITAQLKDRDGNIWLGTQGQGLFRIRAGKCSRFAMAEGLSDDNIISLQEDREGSLWVGTRTGLDRFRDTPLVTITTKEGLSNDNIATVLEAQDGSLFVATLGGGITRMKAGRVSIFNTHNGLPKNSAGDLFESRDGSLWAGMDHGLACIKDGHLRVYTGAGRLSSLYISAICEDDQSLLVACSDLNIYRFKNDRLTPFELRLSPPNGAWQRTSAETIRYVFAMHRDEEGTLWFAMTAGLYRLGRNDPPEKATLTAFRDPALTLYDDGRGYLWITARDLQGFTRLRKSDGTLVRYAPQQGAIADSIGRILSDTKGNLWMACTEGILAIARTELDELAEGRIQRIHPVRYGTIDGLKTEDCGVLGLEPSAWRSQTGKLFFASRKGLLQVDPDRLPHNGLVPPVHIESVTVDGQVHGPEEALRFAPGRENIEIHYSALSLLVPSRVRFRYRLKGFDPAWVEAGTRRTAYYTRLPPGSYSFQVMACNNDGLWNETGASVAFTLRPHFYQTIWFVALLILATVAGIVSLFWLRARQHRLAEQELQKRIHEALVHIKTLHGLLPICAWCHKIRDDKGYWYQIEEYIGTHTQAEFSHGICPDCRGKVSGQSQA